MPQKPPLPERHFKRFRKENNDIMYRIHDGNNSITATKVFNGISTTYMGVKIQIYDDNFMYAQRNASWIFAMDMCDIDMILQQQGFVEVEPNRLEITLWT